MALVVGEVLLCVIVHAVSETWAREIFFLLCRFISLLMAHVDLDRWNGEEATVEEEEATVGEEEEKEEPNSDSDNEAFFLCR